MQVLSIVAWPLVVLLVVWTLVVLLSQSVGQFLKAWAEHLQAHTKMEYALASEKQAAVDLSRETLASQIAVCQAEQRARTAEYNERAALAPSLAEGLLAARIAAEGELLMAQAKNTPNAKAWDTLYKCYEEYSGACVKGRELSLSTWLGDYVLQDGNLVKSTPPAAVIE